MTDKDQAAIFSLNGNSGLPERLEAFDDYNALEDQAAPLAAGLVSLGFIKAAIRRTALFWCILGAVGLVVGVGVNKEYPASYKASTSVLITYGPNENPTSAVLDNQAIAQSRAVAALALGKLGLQESLGTFAPTITAAVVTDRVLLITVSAPSSAAAVSRANAVAAAFLQFRADQMQTAQQLLLKSLGQEVDQARQNVASIKSQISQLSAQPTSSRSRPSSRACRPSSPRRSPRRLLTSKPCRTTRRVPLPSRRSRAAWCSTPRPRSRTPSSRTCSSTPSPDSPSAWPWA